MVKARAAYQLSVFYNSPTLDNEFPPWIRMLMREEPSRPDLISSYWTQLSTLLHWGFKFLTHDLWDRLKP